MYSGPEMNEGKGEEKRLGGYLIAAMLAAFLAGAFLGSYQSSPVQALGKTYDNLEIFADVLSIVEQSYVEEVDPEKLVDGAINGMLRSLDPHSSFMTPELYKEMQVETEGEFGGIGIEITIKDDILTVVTPIEDTPAWKAGIEAGDRIVKVDGESTFDMSLMQAVRKMRGKPGEAVVITVVREGMERPKDFKIIRAVIHVTSVKYELLEDKWGYVRIRSFSKDTGSDLKAALKDLGSQGSKGLVLDLRNDPGGLLNQAVAVSEQFLNKGELIVYTKGRMPNNNMEFTAKRDNKENDFPMVVLVNKGSASASEIVAGALQDLKRAVIVGTQTFGKGSVQTIMPLRSGAGLRLTTAKYYTPSGRQIQGVGITPDIVVEPRPRKVAEAPEEPPHEPSEVEKVKAKVNGDKPENNDKKPSIVKLDEDYQLQRALGVLKSWEVIDGIKDQRRPAAAGRG